MNHEKKHGTGRITRTFLIVAIAAVLVAALAWFNLADTKTPTEPKNVEISISNYFASGAGTASNPYIIKTAQQLNDFAWLQYSGYFNNEKAGNDGKTTIKSKCFKLDVKANSEGKKVLDMTDWTLPPIGTSTNPFLGTFDGNGCTIANLNVTNSSSKNDYTDPIDIVEDSDISNVNVIALFGVVGSIDKSAYSYNKAKNSVKSLYIKNLTVNSQTSSALIGLAVGYMNGNVSNVAVIDSKLQDTVGAKALSYTKNLSDYSLVGYATNKYKETVKDKTETVTKKKTSVKTYTKQVSSTWGGAVSFSSLYSRVKDMSSSASALKYKTAIVQKIDLDGKKSTLDSGVTKTNSDVKTFTSKLATGGAATFINSDDSSIRLYGEHEYKNTTNTTTYNYYYSKSAYYISSGSHYLSARPDGKKSKWVFSADQSMRGTLSTVVDGTTKYLNRDGSSLLFTESDNTYWNVAGDSIYCTSEDGTKVYYLNCSKSGEWSLKLINADSTFISDGSNYLSAGEEGIVNETQKSKAIKWVVEDAEDESYKLKSEDGQYLNYDEQTDTLSLSTEGTLFRQYKSDGELRFYYAGECIRYLNCNGGKWGFDLAYSSGYTIKAHGYYLALNSSNNDLYATKNSKDASIWNADGSKWFAYDNNGTKQYLCEKSNVIGLTTNIEEAHDYSIENDGLYFGYKSKDKQLYVTYSSTKEKWITTEEEKQCTSALKMEYYSNIIYIPSVSADGIQEFTFTKTEDTNRVLSSKSQSTGSYSSLATYIPLTASGSAKEGYKASDNNLGYIIGGTSSKNGDVQLTSQSFKQLYASLGLDSYDEDLKFGSGSKLEVLTATKSTDGETVRIKDKYNKYNLKVSSTISGLSKKEYDDSLGLVLYNSARQSMQSTLGSQGGYFTGITFTGSPVSKNRTTSIAKASMNGTTYSKYEVPESCIDLKVPASGYISFMAASCVENNDSFFSLNHVIRGKNNKIKSIKTISKIYKLSEGCYSYLYTDGSSSDGQKHSSDELVFDMAWMNKNAGTGNQLMKDCMYYFEIPVKAGEYALGSVKGGTSAYLVYLDVQSGPQTITYKETTVTEYVTTTTKSYERPTGVTFAASDEKGGLSDVQCSASVKLSSTGEAMDKPIQYTRAGSKIVVSAVEGILSTYIQKGLSLINGDGKTLKATPKKRSSSKNKRVTQNTHKMTSG